MLWLVLVALFALVGCSEESERELVRAFGELLLAMALVLREWVWARRFLREQQKSDDLSRQVTALSVPPKALGASPSTIEIVDEKTPRRRR